MTATGRIAAVLATASHGGAPAGIDPAVFALALVEDTADVLADLDQCDSAIIACPPSYADAVRPLLWPGSIALVVAAGDTAATTVGALAALHEGGAGQGVLVAGDAPDLPGLLVGKLFSALTSADVAICPAPQGLVAIASRLPAPDWLRAAGVGLDTADAHRQLAEAAPHPDALAVVSGWHRIRSVADIGKLDYGLEGWDVTRALLGGY